MSNTDKLPWYYHQIYLLKNYASDHSLTCLQANILYIVEYCFLWKISIERRIIFDLPVKYCTFPLLVQVKHNNDDVFLIVKHLRCSSFLISGHCFSESQRLQSWWANRWGFNRSLSLCHCGNKQENLRFLIFLLWRQLTGEYTFCKSIF